jgi:hypothetical protein
MEKTFIKKYIKNKRRACWNLSEEALAFDY